MFYLVAGLVVLFAFWVFYGYCKYSRSFSERGPQQCLFMYVIAHPFRSFIMILLCLLSAGLIYFPDSFRKIIEIAEELHVRKTASVAPPVNTEERQEHINVPAAKPEESHGREAASVEPPANTEETQKRINGPVDDRQIRYPDYTSSPSNPTTDIPQGGAQDASR